MVTGFVKKKKKKKVDSGDSPLKCSSCIMVQTNTLYPVSCTIDL